MKDIAIIREEAEAVNGKLSATTYDCHLTRELEP